MTAKVDSAASRTVTSSTTTALSSRRPPNGRSYSRDVSGHPLRPPVPLARRAGRDVRVGPARRHRRRTARARGAEPSRRRGRGASSRDRYAAREERPRPCRSAPTPPASRAPSRGGGRRRCRPSRGADPARDLRAPARELRGSCSDFPGSARRLSGRSAWRPRSCTECREPLAIPLPTRSRTGEGRTPVSSRPPDLRWYDRLPGRRRPACPPRRTGPAGRAPASVFPRARPGPPSRYARTVMRKTTSRNSTASEKAKKPGRRASAAARLPDMSVYGRLAEYNRKRHFDVTPEPPGTARARHAGRPLDSSFRSTARPRFTTTSAWSTAE